MYYAKKHPKIVIISVLSHPLIDNSSFINISNLSPSKLSWRRMLYVRKKASIIWNTFNEDLSRLKLNRFTKWFKADEPFSTLLIVRWKSYESISFCREQEIWFVHV